VEGGITWVAVELDAAKTLKGSQGLVEALSFVSPP
jgi:hypothetical protein